MPCIQFSVAESSKQNNREMNVSDIDDLVKKVSESLKLKAKAKKSVLNNFSPYHKPFQGQNHRHSRSHPKKSEDLDDPHKMLEELLRTGNLIKEAVSRICPPININKTTAPDDNSD